MSGEHSTEAAELAVGKALENERLVLAIASGDQEAERSFVVKYLPKVRAMLLARTRNPELAADLQQDVMIEAICALRRGQLREAAKLSMFVLGIARNLLNSHYQRAARQPVSLEFPDNLPDLAVAKDSIEEEQEQTLARRAISRLAPIDKAILQLTLVDGLKPGVIAERLGLSPDVVRQKKLRATRKVVDSVIKLSQNRSTAYCIAGGEP
jgi:RNA polymerase sigma-70 factor (ECF subfamily)